MAPNRSTVGDVVRWKEMEDAGWRYMNEEIGGVRVARNGVRFKRPTKMLDHN